MDKKAQGSLEYLLLIMGAVLVAILVIAIIIATAQETGVTVAEQQEGQTKCAAKTAMGFDACTAERLEVSPNKFACCAPLNALGLRADRATFSRCGLSSIVTEENINDCPVPPAIPPQACTTAADCDDIVCKTKACTNDVCIYSNVADNTSCSPPTGGTCQSGVCQPTTTCTPGSSCDDGDACTTNDTCDSSENCVGTPVTCPEGQTCENGFCQPSTGTCINGSIQTCTVPGNQGICRDGTQTCSNQTWGTCNTPSRRSDELCGNSLDDDCDGSVDEGCGTGSLCDGVTCAPNAYCDLGTGNCECDTYYANCNATGPADIPGDGCEYYDNTTASPTCPITATPDCTTDTDCGNNAYCGDTYRFGDFYCYCDYYYQDPDPQYSNCDNDWLNGCEVNTQTDPNNCGSCDNACNTGQTCETGSCVGGTPTGGKIIYDPTNDGKDVWNIYDNPTNTAELDNYNYISGSGTADDWMNFYGYDYYGTTWSNEPVGYEIVSTAGDWYDSSDLTSWNLNWRMKTATTQETDGTHYRIYVGLDTDISVNEGDVYVTYSYRDHPTPPSNCNQLGDYYYVSIVQPATWNNGSEYNITRDLQADIDNTCSGLGLTINKIVSFKVRTGNPEYHNGDLSRSGLIKHEQSSISIGDIILNPPS